MSTKKSLAFLSKLAVAASVSALTLSATAETRYWADSNGDTASFNAVDSWDPAPEAMADVADDTIVLNKGTDKVAEVKNGDDVSVKTLYVGWGTLDGGTSMSASKDKGGRLDVSGGTLSVTDTFRLGGGFSDNCSNVVNMTGGKVHAAKLYTSDCNSNGGAKNETLNISGGLFETTGETRLATYGGGITLVNITNGGTFRAGNTVSIGRSGKSVVNVTGAIFDMNGKNLYVGHSGDRAVGELTLDNVLSDVNIDQFRVGNEGGSSGNVVVSGDNTTVKVTYAIYVGKQGNGEFTINGGLVSSAYAVQLGDDNINGNNSVLNLNGGVLKTAQVNVHGTPNAVINWNGGTLQRGNNTFVSNGEMCPASDHLDIRVLAGGAIYDGGDTFSQPLHGAGALVKRGSATATFTGALDLKGGFKVEGGTLNVSNLVRTRFKEISVGDGCHLNLNGASVEVASYKVAGVPKSAGTYSEQGGTITVLSSEALAPASAKWTNAGGDNDVANPDNWTVRNAAGDELLDTVAPAADLPITVVYGPNLPSFDGFENVTWTIEENFSLYTRPAVLDTAAVWYDPSDEANVLCEGNYVTGLKNKGAITANNDTGVDLDLELRNPSDNQKTTLSAAGFNGRRNSVYFNGGPGYRSKGYFPAELTANSPRTLFTVAQGSVEYMVMLSIAKKGSGDNEGRAMLIAHNNMSWSQSYQVGYWDGDSWEQERLSFSNLQSDVPYVFAGRTSLPDNGGVAISAFAIDPDGINHATSGSKTFGSLTTPGDSRYVAFYGAFEISDDPTFWVNRGSNGYQGEALIFTNALSDAEMDAVNAYLKGKWIDQFPAMPDSLVVNAQVDLDRATLTFEKLSGSGSFVDGTVVLTGELEVTVNPDGSVVAPSFDRLVLGEDARLVVKGAKNLPQGELVTVLPFTALTGQFASVVSDKGRVVLRYLEGHVDARRDAGFCISVR